MNKLLKRETAEFCTLQKQSNIQFLNNWDISGTFNVSHVLARKLNSLQILTANHPHKF